MQDFGFFSYAPLGESCIRAIDIYSAIQLGGNHCLSQHNDNDGHDDDDNDVKNTTTSFLCHFYWDWTRKKWEYAFNLGMEINLWMTWNKDGSY